MSVNIWITSKGRAYLKRLDKKSFTNRQMEDDEYWDLQTLNLLWETNRWCPENIQSILAEESSGECAKPETYRDTLFSGNPSSVYRSAIKRLSEKGYIEDDLDWSQIA